MGLSSAASERGNRTSRYHTRPLHSNTDAGSLSPSNGLDSASALTPTIAAANIPTGMNSTSAPSGSITEPSRAIYQYRKAIAHPTQQCLFTCYISPSRVGAVIGRGGKNILHIQRRAMKKSMNQGNDVRLSVVSHGSGTGNGPGSPPASASSAPHHDDDLNMNTNGIGNDESLNSLDRDEVVQDNGGDDADLWTPVIIRGDPCGAFAAARLLIPLLSAGNGSMDANTSIEEDLDGSFASGSANSNTNHNAAEDSGAFNGMDDVVLEIPIQRARHSVIIGKKGLTIANLSARYNVRIMVPHRNMEKTNSANINIVQLEGQLDNVEQCLASMLKVVCSLPLTTINDKTPSGSMNSNGTSSNLTDSDAKGNGNSPLLSASSNGPESRSGPGISIAITSKKESKYVEKTITVPPELYNLVPSLGRIRIVGKSTNTVIRRKKFSEAPDDVNTAMNNKEGDTDTAAIAEEPNGSAISSPDSSPKKKKIDSPCTTQLIISGKNEAVKNAIIQLQKILCPGSESSEVDDEKADGTATSDGENEKNGKSSDYQPRRGGRGRGRSGRGRGRGKGRGRQKTDTAT